MQKHRKRDDRVGVIVFGRDAAIEIPPFDYNRAVAKIETPVDPEYTEHRRGDEAGPGHVSRRRRQADRAGQRRQPEPRQRRWSRPRAWRPPASASTCCRSATATWPRWRSSAWSCPPTSAAASPSTCAWCSTTSRADRRAGTTPAWSTASWSSINRLPSEPSLLSEERRHAAAGEEGLHHPPADRRPQLLHLRGPLHPRPARRRHHAAEQSGDRLHPGAGQGPGALDRGLRARGRARRAGRAAAATRPASDRRRSDQLPFRAWPSCSPTTRWCWPTCPAPPTRTSISATSRSTCWCATRSRWARAW